MADRLQELLQQRALLKEHLAWLDAEIAAASGQATGARKADSAAPAPLPAIKPFLTPSAPIVVPKPRVPDDADALLAKLAVEERAKPLPKLGCWLGFGALLVAGAIGVWAMIHFSAH